MTALALRNEARVRLWERGLSIAEMPAEEWIAAVDEQVTHLSGSPDPLIVEALASLDAERAAYTGLKSLYDQLLGDYPFNGGRLGVAWQADGPFSDSSEAERSASTAYSRGGN